LLWLGTAVNLVNGAEEHSCPYTASRETGNFSRKTLLFLFSFSPKEK
jgi:hypothetical protein